MKSIKVALLQMVASKDDQPLNTSKGMDFCRRAAAMGADIALFPEIWNIGYSTYDPEKAGDRERWLSGAIRSNSDYVNGFRSLAKELNMAMVLTYLEKWDGWPRNVATLIDRQGGLVMTYAKVHTCDFEVMEASCTPGDDFHVGELDTAAGPVKVGIMICYDREFPESARILMLKGAEIILTPNACGLESMRLGQFQTRAFENAVGVAMTNYAAPQNNGHSIACNVDGAVNVAAGDQEGIFIADFDLEVIRQYRMKTIWGNAFRRPRRYDRLLDEAVEKPFVRRDAHQQPFDRKQR